LRYARAIRNRARKRAAHVCDRCRHLPAADRLAAPIASITPEIDVPVLWFYARNDQYIGPAPPRLWFDSFNCRRTRQADRHRPLS
jgi:hypothetical protein